MLNIRVSGTALFLGLLGFLFVVGIDDPYGGAVWDTMKRAFIPETVGERLRRECTSITREVGFADRPWDSITPSFRSISSGDALANGDCGADDRHVDA